MEEAVEFSKLGVLLMNTGTADEPTVEAVRAYLSEFLMDPAIIGAPRAIRKQLVRHICKHRPERTVANYEAFWTPEGSPFILTSREQCTLLAASLTEALGSPVHVALAMRYGNPGIPAGLRELRDAGCDGVVVLPCYPQQVSVCAGTCLKAANAEFERLRADGWQAESVDIFNFYEQPAYRRALVDRVAASWTYTPGAKLVVSFHSTLMADIEAGDPYRDQAEATRDFLAEGLGIPAEDVVLSYQSRFDNRKWLQPFTAPTVLELAAQGVRDICVVCPIFTATNLETAIEVDRDLRKTFLDAAGEGATFTYVPELNTDAGLIEALTAEVLSALADPQDYRQFPDPGQDTSLPGMLHPSASFAGKRCK